MLVNVSKTANHPMRKFLDWKRNDRLSTTTKDLHLHIQVKVIATTIILRPVIPAG